MLELKTINNNYNMKVNISIQIIRKSWAWRLESYLTCFNIRN